MESTQEDMAARQERRRGRWINPRLQFRIALRVSAIPLIALLISGTCLGVLTARVLDQSQVLDDEVPGLQPMCYAALAFMLTTGAVIATQAVRYSHCIAGPMVRLVRSIAAIRSGKLDFTVCLRQGDELTQIADELNLLIEHLRGQGVVLGERKGDPAATNLLHTTPGVRVESDLLVAAGGDGKKGDRG